MKNKGFSRRAILWALLIFLLLLTFKISLNKNPRYTNYDRHDFKPETPQGYHLLAKSLAQDGDFEAAKAAALKALELDGKFAKGYMDLANVHYQQGDFNKSEKVYMRAMKYVGRDLINIEVIYFDLGLVYEAKRDAKKAWKYLRKAYKRKSYLVKQWEGLDSLSDLNYVTKNNKKGFLKYIRNQQDLVPIQISNRIKRIETDLYKHHKYEKVISDSRQFLCDNPDSRYAYLFIEALSSALIETGRHKEALKNLSTLLRNPLPRQHNGWVKEQIARSFYLHKDYDKTLWHLFDIVNNNEDYEAIASIYFDISKIYKEKNNLPEAAKILERFINRFPKSRQAKAAHLRLGAIYQAQGDKGRGYLEYKKTGLLWFFLFGSILLNFVWLWLFMWFFGLVSKMFIKNKIASADQKVFPRADIFLFLVLLYYIPLAIVLYISYIFLGDFLISIYVLKGIHARLILWSFFISDIALVFICLRFLKRKYRLDNISLGFFSRGFKFNCLLPLAVVLSSIIIAFLFASFIQALGLKTPDTPLEEITQNIFKEGSWFNLFFLFIIIVIATPIVEEVVFRVFLYRALKYHTNALWAVLFSAGVFAFSHYVAILMPFFFILGVIFAVMYEKTKTIIPCIVTHALYNLIIFTIFLLASAIH